MINLQLPTTDGFAYSSQCADRSESSTQWLRYSKCRGRVRFQIWEEFPSVLREVTSFVRRLGQSQYQDAEDCLRFARRLLRNGAKTEPAITSGIDQSTTRAAKSLFAHYRNYSYLSRWLFMSQVSVNTDLVRAGLRSPQRHSAVDRPMTGIPDVSLFCSRDEAEGENRKAPFATVEIKHSYARIVPDGLRNGSVSDLADYFSTEFEKEVAAVSDPARRLAQALSYAMMSRSGCGWLWTHNQALFFYVDKVQTYRHGVRQVVVRISPLLFCNGHPSTIHGIMAWMLEARRLACVGDETAKVDRLRELYECLQTVGSDEWLYEYPEALGSSGGGSPVAYRTRGSASGGAGSSSTQQTARMREPSFVKQELHRWETRFLQSVERQRLQKVLPYMLERIDNALIEQAFRSRGELIGWGRGGIVVRSTVEGEEVALKYWNSAYLDTFDMIVNEIATYCDMASRNAKSLGFVVPDLVGIGMQYWVGPVILTKAVGESVHRCGEKIKVGGNELNDTETAEMREALLKCVQDLHRDGVHHGDIALRNIRAEKKKGEISVRPWLVDLGLATLRTGEAFVEDDGYMSRDERKCRELF